MLVARKRQGWTAKKSLPQNNNDNWRDVVDQLLKYDDDLTGWWTDNEFISVSCPVLLLHISRSADFGMYLNRGLEQS
jgi:hypothetical protein